MKRSIVFIIVCALLSGYLIYCGDSQAADSYGSSVVTYEYGSYVNPLYEGTDSGTVADEVILPAAYSDSSQIGTYSELVAHYRDVMLERKTNDVITYSGSLNGLSEKELVARAIEDAYADDDNCNPDEGDYLHYSFSSYSFSLSIAGGRFTANVTFKYHTTIAEEAQVTAKVNSLIESWNASSLTEMEKVKLVHDYVVTNVSYDYSYSKYSAYNAIVQGTSVCQGYTLLTQRLLRELGVQVRIVTGEGQSAKHAWNIVKIGDKYYNIDCTWDSNHSSYDLSDESWNIGYNYYLLSDEDFTDHVRDDKFLTEEFVSRHPIYMQSYYEDDEINVPAGTYSFNSVSDSVISNANDSITILVMGNLIAPGTENVLGSIALRKVEYTEGVRVIAVDISKNGKSTVWQKVSSISEGITACYDNSLSAKNTMFSLAGKANLLSGDNTVTIPVILVIDSDSNIRYAYTGSTISGGRLLNCIYNLKPELRPKEAPVPTISPTKRPENEATSEPASEPTSEATSEPAGEATSKPAGEATSEPTNVPADNSGNTPAPTAVTGDGDIVNIAVYPTPKANQDELSVVESTSRIRAGESFNVSGLKYKVTSASSGKYTVKCMGAVKKNIKKLVIPARVKYKNKSFKVTVINTGAFKNNKNIRTLTIGKNVVTIMNKAFYKCGNINKINFIGEKIQFIGKKSFSVKLNDKNMLR